MKSPRSVIVATTFVLLAAFAVAQQAHFSTPQFSITFNGRVTAWANPNKTSVDKFFASKNASVAQTVVYRNIDSGIDVDAASLDFYIKQLTKHEVVRGRQDGTNKGQMFAYFETTTPDNSQHRYWLVIHDPRTMFLLMETTPDGLDDSAEWNAFSNSFVINETPSRAPQGCDQR